VGQVKVTHVQLCSTPGRLPQYYTVGPCDCLLTSIGQLNLPSLWGR